MTEIGQVFEQEVVILTPGGRLDADTAPALEARLATVEEAKAVILDLGATDYVSSAGLRVILAAAKRNMGVGRPFLLCRLTPSVSEVFRLTGFHHILDIQPDVDAAMNHIAPDT